MQKTLSINQMLIIPIRNTCLNGVCISNVKQGKMMKIARLIIAESIYYIMVQGRITPKSRQFLQLKNVKQLIVNYLTFIRVRLIGLEPTQRKLPDPKSGASTNFATGALYVFLMPLTVVHVMECWCMAKKCLNGAKVLSFY